ncbi:hypothetical protein [Corynebacterium oculi]|uniref:Uncharacterized protein n=1 Tax=Corynebacterium oculi TaxID=1544416 RepID=A0A0Q0YCH8_9CORY|nr:hypothetical protein [Corynebacterium oculi]KQB83902.1 hypothetical protein Cocul_01978 [Corynebacterium oculi]
MHAKRFLTAATAAVIITSSMITPAYSAEGSSTPNEGSTLPVDTREYNELDVTPEQKEELVKRKEELSTEQSKVSFDVVKSITQIALFFSGVGIPAMPLLSAL